jgi:acyl dehydratase
LHGDLKRLLDLPDAVVTEVAMTFVEPVRPGDVISHAQTVRSVGAETSTALGTGRFWVIDLDYRNQRGDLVGTETTTAFGHRRRDRPVDRPTAPPPPPNAARPGGDDEVEGGVGFGVGTNLTFDRAAATERLPTRTEVVPTAGDAAAGPIDATTEAAWFEHHLTRWTGPAGRLGWVTVRPMHPVAAGDEMTLSGRVHRAEVDATGCGWVEVDLRLAVADRTHAAGSARIAVPVAEGDNPWDRRGDRWRP